MAHYFTASKPDQAAQPVGVHEAPPEAPTHGIEFFATIVSYPNSIFDIHIIGQKSLTFLSAVRSLRLDVYKRLKEKLMNEGGTVLADSAVL